MREVAKGAEAPARRLREHTTGHSYGPLVSVHQEAAEGALEKADLACMIRDGHDCATAGRGYFTWTPEHGAATVAARGGKKNG